MELGISRLQRNGLNVLRNAFHCRHGLMWTDGHAVFLSPIHIHGNTTIEKSKGPIKVGEFDVVHSLHWSCDVETRACYLCVVHSQIVSIWRVDGDVPGLTFKQVRKINASPIAQGCLWNPTCDVLCLLCRDQCSFYFYHTQQRGSYALPQLDSGSFTAGSWSKDGSKLALAVATTLILVYSWTDIHTSVHHFTPTAWRLHSPAGAVSCISCINNTSFILSLELSLEQVIRSPDSFIIPGAASGQSKTCLQTDENGVLRLSGEATPSFVDGLLNLQPDPQISTGNAAQLLVMDVGRQGDDPHEITRVNVKQLMTPDLLIYSERNRSAVVGSNAQNALQIFAYAGGKLQKIRDICLEKGCRPKGVCCTGVESSRNQHIPVLILSAKHTLDTPDQTFLPSSSDALYNISLHLYDIAVAKSDSSWRPPLPVKQKHVYRSLHDLSPTNEKAEYKLSHSTENIVSLSKKKMHRSFDKSLTQLQDVANNNETVCENANDIYIMPNITVAMDINDRMKTQNWVHDNSPIEGIIHYPYHIDGKIESRQSAIVDDCSASNANVQRKRSSSSMGTSSHTNTPSYSNNNSSTRSETNWHSKGQVPQAQDASANLHSKGQVPQAQDASANSHSKGQAPQTQDASPILHSKCQAPQAQDSSAISHSKGRAPQAQNASAISHSKGQAPQPMSRSKRSSLHSACPWSKGTAGQMSRQDGLVLIPHQSTPGMTATNMMMLHNSSESSDAASPAQSPLITARQKHHQPPCQPLYDQHTIVSSSSSSSSAPLHTSSPILQKSSPSFPAPVNKSSCSVSHVMAQSGDVMQQGSRVAQSGNVMQYGSGIALSGNAMQQGIGIVQSGDVERQGRRILQSGDVTKHGGGSVIMNASSGADSFDESALPVMSNNVHSSGYASDLSFSAHHHDTVYCTSAEILELPPPVALKGRKNRSNLQSGTLPNTRRCSDLGDYSTVQTAVIMPHHQRRRSLNGPFSDNYRESSKGMRDVPVPPIRRKKPVLEIPSNITQTHTSELELYKTNFSEQQPNFKNTCPSQFDERNLVSSEVARNLIQFGNRCPISSDAGTQWTESSSHAEAEVENNDNYTMSDLDEALAEQAVDDRLKRPSNYAVSENPLSTYELSKISVAINQLELSESDSKGYSKPPIAIALHPSNTGPLHQPSNTVPLHQPSNTVPLDQPQTTVPLCRTATEPPNMQTLPGIAMLHQPMLVSQPTHLASRPPLLAPKPPVIASKPARLASQAALIVSKPPLLARVPAVASRSAGSSDPIHDSLPKESVTMLDSDADVHLEESLERQLKAQQEHIAELKRRVNELQQFVDNTSSVYATSYQSMKHPDQVELVLAHSDGARRGKVFLLDSGRLKLDIVLNTFGLSSLDVIIDGLALTVGCNIDGYIPLRFESGSIVQVCGMEIVRSVRGCENYSDQQKVQHTICITQF